MKAEQKDMQNSGTEEALKAKPESLVAAVEREMQARQQLNALLEQARQLIGPMAMNATPQRCIMVSKAESEERAKKALKEQAEARRNEHRIKMQSERAERTLGLLSRLISSVKKEMSAIRSVTSDIGLDDAMLEAQWLLLQISNSEKRAELWSGAARAYYREERELLLLAAKKKSEAERCEGKAQEVMEEITEYKTSSLWKTAKDLTKIARKTTVKRKKATRELLKKAAKLVQRLRRPAFLGVVDVEQLDQLDRGLVLMRNAVNSEGESF